MGILSFQIFFVSCGTKFEISVAIYPGETELARANRTHSTARDLPGKSALQYWCVQVLTKVDNARLGRIVSSLHLREIDDMPAHRRRRDEAAVVEVGQFVAVQIGALVLLSPPMRSSSLGAVECPIKVASHNARVVIQRPVHHGSLGPGNARVGDEDIQAPVHLAHDGIDDNLDGVGVGDVDLVSLGWDS